MNKDISEYILCWVEDNLYTGATISELAKSVGYSRRTLETGFRRDYGLSLGNYLFRRRMARAAVTLRLARLTITELALLLHYCSAANFTRAFHRYYGQTPDAYRRSQLWDTSLLQVPLHYESPEYNSERVHLNSPVFIAGESFRYQAQYTNTLDDSFMENFRKHIKKWAPSYHEDIWTVTSMHIPESIAVNRKGLVDVDVVVGTQLQHERNSVAVIPSGNYTRFSFSGSWNKYIIFSRLAYTRCLEGKKWCGLGTSCFMKITLLDVVAEQLSCQLYISVE
ncbi:AraC family transcriptional regulator [Citrobacter sp. Cpo090]|uniref:helix-turn-helix transcriptional regulator n=1 Tax=Citrobacter sp. Cpo090 TaxID=2985139 RepID=UPI002576250F|nr:AraC family transcriptional regulator [Citrobacter sp. Cpo090]MDM2843552.1 AraC family transcriptional regulator [Citrobacter sp. Cpo090]